MAEKPTPKNRIVKAKKWRNVADEMLQDPEAYYREADERATALASKTVRRTPHFRMGSRNHKIA